jgi:L,D-transpeptidase ErfK/SrfK
MDNENSNNMDKQNENFEVPEQTFQNEPKRKTFFNTFWGKLLKGILIIVSLFIIVFILPFILQRFIMPVTAFRPGHVSEKESAEMAESKEILEKSIAKLDDQLNALIPKDCYMIINSTDNVFTLKKGNEIVRTGKCSTGSYLMLESEKKQKKWLFKTPKGQLTVKSKKTDPVWTKPDWAFIEEGLPVPGPNHSSRFEEGVLGDYALVLGDGYMIHGTIWQRYLGLSVTHGCVRLNDADLEVVYKSLNKGSKVYIF